MSERTPRPVSLALGLRSVVAVTRLTMRKTLFARRSLWV